MDPYLRAAKKFPKVKQQAAERLSRRPDRPVTPQPPVTPPKGKP
jgi:hypothetical protein